MDELDEKKYAVLNGTHIREEESEVESEEGEGLRLALVGALVFWHPHMELTEANLFQRCSSAA